MMSLRINAWIGIGAMVVALAVGASAPAQAVTVTVDPPVAPLGQPFRITVTNGLAVTVDSVLFFAVVTDQNQVWGPPPPPPGLFPLAPGRSRSWVWSQTHYQTQQQAPPGAYSASFDYWLGTGPVARSVTPFRIDAITLRASGPATRGTVLPLALDASGSAGLPYQVAASLRNAPGIRVGAGRLLLLEPDALFAQTLLGGPLFGGFAGMLDASGRGTANLTIPSIPQLAGVQLYAAFATLDPSAPFGIRQHSNAEPILIQ